MNIPTSIVKSMREELVFSGAQVIAGDTKVVPRGTFAEQTELVVEKQEMLVSCGCGYQGLIRDRRFVCPVCGVADVDVTAGEEMILQQLELEVGE